MRVARGAGLALGAGLLMAVVGLLGILLGAAGKPLQEQAETLLRAYPLRALILLVAALFVLSGLLSWAIDRLRKG